MGPLCKILLTKVCKSREVARPVTDPLASQHSWDFFGVFLISWCTKCFQFGEMSRLQTDQFGTRSILQKSHVCARAAVCFNTCLLHFARSSLKKKTHHVYGSICCSNTCRHLSALVVSFQVYKLPVLHLWYHQKSRLLNDVLMRSCPLSSLVWRMKRLWLENLFTSESLPL